MRTARSILETEVNTLVIHMDDRSTDFLKAIYEGKGYPVVTGAMKLEEARAAIKAAGRVFMLGHGGPSGLFTRGFFAGDEEIGALLAEKQDGLYIWCNADAFAVRNKLTGLVSGMFISEVGEAAMFGIKATQQQVDASNAAFSRELRQIMDSGQPHASIRQKYCDAACQITQFNNERLYVFDHGVPTPALHQTSAANWGSRKVPDIKHQDEPDQAPEDDGLFKEIENQVIYWTSAVLDKITQPEEAAEGIVRHIPYGDELYDDVLAALKSVLAQDVSYQDGIQMVLDVIVN